MLWTEELFGVKKPILAMLHLDALPGDPRFRRGTPLGEIVEHARADLHALQDGGVDGIIFSNEFSFPYQRKMDMVTPAAMAYIIGALRSEIRVPFGVDAISDGAACLELAAAVGASYVRGTFSGVYVGDGGLYNNDFSALLRRKAALPLDDLKMLYFINPESDRNLECISANAAGMDVDEELIASVKAANPEVVVLCNTGCRPDTIVRKLQAGDAAVVGTYFKENGKLENSRHENVRVDIERVREFMAVVYRFRETL